MIWETEVQRGGILTPGVTGERDWTRGLLTTGHSYSAYLTFLFRVICSAGGLEEGHYNSLSKVHEDFRPPGESYVRQVAQGGFTQRGIVCEGPKYCHTEVTEDTAPREQP